MNYINAAIQLINKYISDDSSETTASARPKLLCVGATHSQSAKTSKTAAYDKIIRRETKQAVFDSFIMTKQ